MFRNLFFRRFRRTMESYEITFDELKQKQANGAKIVDVRSEQEYNEGHIKYAINIPEYKINNGVINILNDRNLEIVLYCKTGARSKKAYRKLKRLGYKNVFVGMVPIST